MYLMMYQISISTLHINPYIIFNIIVYNIIKKTISKQISNSLNSQGQFLNHASTTYRL